MLERHLRAQRRPRRWSTYQPNKMPPWRMAVKSEGSYGQECYGIATRAPCKGSFYSKWASKISKSRSEGFATGIPSAPMLNSRHKVGTRIPEKR